MHGDISMDMILHFVFSLVLSLSTSFADEVSKACFGVVLPCTKHNLRCSSGRIAIQEAFYMEGTPCAYGVSNCVNISLSSIQLTGTRYNFNDTEMDFLYRNCSTQSKCTFRADRRGEISFSALIYECVNASCNHNITCNETTTTGATPAIIPQHLKTTRPKTSTKTGKQGTTQQILPSLTSPGPLKVDQPGKPTTGTVVGIIIPICIVIAGVVTAVLIFRRRKIRQKGENGIIAKPKSNPQEVHSKEKTSSPDYDYATTNGHLHLVPKAHDMPAPPKGSSGYDYANCGDQKANHDHLSTRNTQTREGDYDHIGRQPARAHGHYDTTQSAADTLKRGNAKQEVYSFNLNAKVSNNAHVDSTYNTTASTRHNLDASSNNMEDHYGYNHLGTESKTNLPQSEYDTTASAIQDVSRMNGNMEDSTYNHAHFITSGYSSGMINAGFQESDYDHAFPLNMVNINEYKCNASPKENPQEDVGTDVYMLAREAEANPYQLAK